MQYVVAIVVDPEFGNRLANLLERMPVWIADTETNRAAAARADASRSQSDQGVSHTAIGALTTFTIDRDATPDSWCAGILDTVAGHHDRYSHSPGYSALEIYGAEPSPTLLAALAEYRLTDIAAFPADFGRVHRMGSRPDRQMMRNFAQRRHRVIGRRFW